MDAIWADGGVPRLTTEQMVEVDRAMIEDFGIDLPRMMENAGRNLAHLARERFLDGDADGKRIAVLAGSGGNGGGALVAARRLHGYGAEVQVTLARRSEEMTPVAAQQLAMVKEIGIDVVVGLPPGDAFDLVLDGLIGYSLKGAPRRTQRRSDQLGEQECGTGAFAGCSLGTRHDHGNGVRPRRACQCDDDAGSAEAGPIRPRCGRCGR